MQISIGDTIHGYTIIKEIKGGGMSRVFVAEPTKNVKCSGYSKVILKVITKKMIESSDDSEKAKQNQWEKALNEFELTWQIFQTPSDYIAKALDWYIAEDNSHVIIISEFIDGPCLSKYLEKQKAIKLDRAILYFKNICKGVRHLHTINPQRTIIHRDLKADNIMLSQDLRQIKIIDYGIATSFYNNVFESNEGTIYCTAYYTTPDVLLIDKKILDGVNANEKKAIEEMSRIISVQFDFHALGVILYEMLTGDVPFRTDKEDAISDRAKIKRWQSYDLPLLSSSLMNVPTSIDNIIFRLTASKPEDKKYRYKSMDEVIEDLNTWDDPKRADEPLIKPIEKRNFQEKPVFDVSALKANEKIWNKWWMFITINASAFTIIALVVILVSLKLSAGIF